jgi:hypothetical protein
MNPRRKKSVIPLSVYIPPAGDRHNDAALSEFVPKQNALLNGLLKKKLRSNLPSYDAGYFAGSKCPCQPSTLIGDVIGYARDRNKIAENREAG